MTPLLLQAYTECGVTRITFSLNQMLPYAHPDGTIALGGEVLILPHPGRHLGWFVYKRTSSFMNDNREKLSLPMLPIRCLIG